LERDREKARKVMEAAKIEYAEYLEELQSKLSSDVLDMLVNICASYTIYHGQGYAELSAVKDYLDSLSVWCTQEEEYFKGVVGLREEAWTSAKQVEEQTRINPLIEVLCFPPLTVLRCLRDAERSCGVSSQTVSTFVRLLDVTKKGPPLFSAMIVNEVSAAQSGSSLFSSNGCALEVLYECSRFYSADFFTKLLEQPISKICDNPKNYLITSEDGIMNLLGEINAILHALLESKEGIPEFYRQICSNIRKITPEEAHSGLLISSLILGRIITPALQEPQRFGIRKETNSEHAQGSFYFMGQFLHMIISDEAFPTSHTFGAQLNQDIASWRQVLANFWQEITCEGDDTNGEQNIQDPSVEANKLRESLKSHFHLVCQALNDLNERETYIELTSALGYLELDKPSNSNGNIEVL